MCEQWKIKHQVGSTRHLRSQGQVEAVNKLIEDRVRKSMPGSLTDWDLHHPKAMFDINNRIVASIGTSRWWR
jgi:hypothetical protein